MTDEEEFERWSYGHTFGTDYIEESRISWLASRKELREENERLKSAIHILEQDVEHERLLTKEWVEKMKQPGITEGK